MTYADETESEIIKTKRLMKTTEMKVLLTGKTLYDAKQNQTIEREHILEDVKNRQSALFKEGRKTNVMLTLKPLSRE